MDFPDSCRAQCLNGERSIEFLWNKTREKDRCPKYYTTDSPPFTKMIEKVDLTCFPKDYVLCSYCPMVTEIKEDNPLDPSYLKIVIDNRKEALHQYKRNLICDYVPTDLCTHWRLDSGFCYKCQRYYN